MFRNPLWQPSICQSCGVANPKTHAHGPRSSVQSGRRYLDSLEEAIGKLECLANVVVIVSMTDAT